LEEGSDAALSAYLAFVRDESTRRDALAVANSSQHLPLAALLASLDHEDKSVRRSAAVVLGHVNGPEVTQALIARVTEKPSGATEVRMALLACRGEAAAEFIAYASSRPQLLGHLNSARLQWEYGIQ
jgi:HEAT repeat protein